METESFLKKVSEASEEFYERFVSLFHSRKTITTAITGLLVLHLFVEIGHFIMPYTTGLMYPWYFEQMGAGHTPLPELMAADFTLAAGWLAKTAVIFSYTLNVVAVLMLFAAPAYVWHYIYKNKKADMPNISWLFFGALSVLLLRPVIALGQIKTGLLIGADITTKHLLLDNIQPILLATAAVMAIFYALGRERKERTTKLAFTLAFVYFGIYLYHFFMSTASFYVKTTIMLAQGHEYFIALHLLIFLSMIILFYIGGYGIFIYEAYAKQKI